MTQTTKMDIEEKQAAQACSKQESDPTPNLKKFMNEDREKILRQLREWKSYANTDDMRNFVGIELEAKYLEIAKQRIEETYV